MLVQLAGGETETIQQLQDAGYRSATDLVDADPEELRDAGGMTLAAARRLIKAAGQQLKEMVDSEPTGPLKKALSDVGSAGEKSKRGSAAVKAQGTKADEVGVSVEETRSIAGSSPEPHSQTGSFWSFG